jgi:hypothetical protein
MSSTVTDVKGYQWYAGVSGATSPTPNCLTISRGVRSSEWGRTGPECLADFSDIIWINTTNGSSYDG